MGQYSMQIRGLSGSILGAIQQAMVDAEYTAHLFMHIQYEITRRYKIKEIDHKLLLSIQTTPKNQIDQCVERYKIDK